MMSDDRQKYVDQILKAIEYGNLPREDMERRLRDIIEAELSEKNGNTANMVLVDLCTSLLWQLGTHALIPYENQIEESKRIVKKRLEKKKHRNQVTKRILFNMAAVIIIVIIFFSLHILPPIRWFSGGSTPDEEQYVIEGHEFSFQAVAHSIKQKGGEGECGSKSKEEIDKYLGFDVFIPDSLCDEYFASMYYTTIMNHSIEYICQYSNDNNEEVILRLSFFDDSEIAYLQFEQNRNGNKKIINNTTVYSSINEGKITTLWYKDNIFYSVFYSQDIPFSDQIINELLIWRDKK